MKAHVRKQPQLVTILELNKRYGYGYQGRLIMDGVIDSVIDNEPYNLYEIASGMKAALDEINKATGYHYELHKVLRVTDEALKINKDKDLASAKIFRDIKCGNYEMTRPAQADYKTAEVDGEEQVLLSGRGVVKFVYFSWMDDKLPKAREGLLRYCEYLAMHGCGGGAKEIMSELDELDKDAGIDWIERTYARHVKDDAALMKYVMAT